MRNCVRKLYRQARQLTFDAPEAAVYLAMRLQADHRAGFMPQVGKGSVFPKGNRGFARTIDGDKCFAVTMERAERIVGPKVLDNVVAELRNKAVLIPGADKKSTRQLQVQGFNSQNRARFLCLRRDKLKTLVMSRPATWTGAHADQ